MLTAQPSAGPHANSIAAECWFSLGLSTILTGNVDEGRRYLETSLELARDIGDAGLEVVVLRMIVHGLLDGGQIDAAESCVARILAVADGLPTSWEKAGALGAIAMVHRARGDYDRAANYFQQEMAMWRTTGDNWMLAASASDAAEAELQRRNVESARSLALEMLAPADAHDAPTLAWNLEILGRALAAHGHALTAARVWGRCRGGVRVHGAEDSSVYGACVRARGQRRSGGGQR